MEQALIEHPAFEPGASGYILTTSPLDAVVVPGGDRLEITVRMPALRAVVRDATVPDVVEASWFETLSRRLDDGYDVARVAAGGPPVVDSTDDTVSVTYRIVGDAPEVAVEDAKAIIEFVVGTYLQGAIPGYEYDSPMRELLSNAHTRGGSDGSD